MRVVHECCAGFDVHKKSVYVCILRCGENGDRTQQVRSFGTMTKDLLTLADWLKDQGVTHVAMEATGVYWRFTGGPCGRSLKVSFNCCW